MTFRLLLTALPMVLAATLICGASVFTSCSSDDNPVNPIIVTGTGT